MANRLFKQFQGTLEAGIVTLYGQVVTGTSGAISSSSCKGFSIVKTASKTGRYTVTLDDTYTGLWYVGVNVVGTADAAYTGSKGVAYILRNDTIASGGKTFDIQFTSLVASPADVEVENSASLKIVIELKNTSAY